MRRYALSVWTICLLILAPVLPAPDLTLHQDCVPIACAALDFRVLRGGSSTNPGRCLNINRPLARQLGINLDIHACKRVRNTIPQTDLPAKKRKRNVHNAFFVIEEIGYNHALIIDDVITTGSTVNELARTLQKAGVGKIDVLACAKTI
jgi:hypothetical protein